LIVPAVAGLILTVPVPVGLMSTCELAGSKGLGIAPQLQ
jgi:hypothetical protein